MKLNYVIKLKSMTEDFKELDILFDKLTKKIKSNPIYINYLNSKKKLNKSNHFNALIFRKIELEELYFTYLTFEDKTKLNEIKKELDLLLKQIKSLKEVREYIINEAKLNYLIDLISLYVFKYQNFDIAKFDKEKEIKKLFIKLYLALNS